MPAGTGTKHPEHTVDEPAVIRCRSAHRVRTSRQQTLDPPPLRIAQLISTYAHPNRTTNQPQKAKSICRYALGRSPRNRRHPSPLPLCRRPECSRRRNDRIAFLRPPHAAKRPPRNASRRPRRTRRPECSRRRNDKIAFLRAPARRQPPTPRSPPPSAQDPKAGVQPQAQRPNCLPPPPHAANRPPRNASRRPRRTAGPQAPVKPPNPTKTAKPPIPIGDLYFPDLAYLPPPTRYNRSSPQTPAGPSQFPTHSAQSDCHKSAPKPTALKTLGPKVPRGGGGHPAAGPTAKTSTSAWSNSTDRSPAATGSPAPACNTPC